MTDAAVVLTTVGSREAGRSIARRLVAERLAACVQMVPIDSVYRWEGETVEEGETLLLVKTRRALYAVERAILDDHPYETPEVVMLAVEAGAAGYLTWLDESTAPQR